MKSTAEEQKEKVRAAYGEIARTRAAAGAATCCAPPGAGPDYSAEEIASVPPGAYLSEGSGNPVRAARLEPGETVVDLGSGAGMDVFLAAHRVGPAGRGRGGEPGRLRRALLDLAPCSCVATALAENAYLETIRGAGFEGVEIVAERPAVSQPLDTLVRAQAVTLVGGQHLRAPPPPEPPGARAW